MSEVVKKESVIRKKELILIFLCWLVYTAAYLGKFSYTTNIVVITDYFNVSKSEVGLVSTLFFICYGVGQIVNGILCSKYSKKYSIFIALFVSSLVNLVLFFDIPFEMIKYLWLLNGVAQSILWPTLMQTIGTYVRKDKLKTAVVTMSTTIALGTILAYSVSAIFVRFSFFKYTFLLTSIILLIVSLTWFFGYKMSVEKGLTPQNEVVNTTNNEEVSKETAKKSVSSSFLILLICLMVFAVINNFIKDGLNTWVPNILKDMFAFDDSLSIILTVSLSILGIFGTVCATTLNKYIKNFGTLSGVFFTASALLIGIVIFLLNTNYWLLVVICFSVISLLMHAINNIITSMFPLYMQDKGNAGFLSGILNGACYVGSAISAYGLGAFADAYGWNSVFKLLFGCCLLPIVISVILAIMTRKKSKKVISTNEN